MAWTVLQKTIGHTSVAEPLSATSIPCSQAIIQGYRANSGAIRIGDSNVTGTVGHELVAPTSGAYMAALTLISKGGNGLDLSTIYIFGTAADGVNILYEIF